MWNVKSQSTVAATGLGTIGALTHWRWLTHIKNYDWTLFGEMTTVLWDLGPLPVSFWMSLSLKNTKDHYQLFTHTKKTKTKKNLILPSLGMNAPDKLKLSTFTTYSELKINRRKTSGVSPELNSTCLRNYRKKKQKRLNSHTKKMKEIKWISVAHWHGVIKLKQIK